MCALCTHAYLPACLCLCLCLCLAVCLPVSRSVRPSAFLYVTMSTCVQSCRDTGLSSAGLYVSLFVCAYVHLYTSKYVCPSLSLLCFFSVCLVTVCSPACSRACLLACLLARSFVFRVCESLKLFCTHHALFVGPCVRFHAGWQANIKPPLCGQSTPGINIFVDHV